jgi:hypothetical protein
MPHHHSDLVLLPAGPAGHLGRGREALRRSRIVAALFIGAAREEPEVRCDRRRYFFAPALLLVV